MDVRQRAVYLHPSYVRDELTKLTQQVFRPSKELTPPNAAYPVTHKTPHPVACVFCLVPHAPSLPGCVTGFCGADKLAINSRIPSLPRQVHQQAIQRGAGRANTPTSQRQRVQGPRLARLFRREYTLQNSSVCKVVLH